MREKGRKAMIYKARKDRRKKKSKIGGEKRKEKNHIFGACPKRIEGEIPRSYSRPFLH